MRSASGGDGYRPDLRNLRVAFVCDSLFVYGGAERVLEQMLACLPEADLFALVDFVPEGERHFLLGKQVRTTFVQRLPFARNHFRNYLPLFPFAIEQLDMTRYDLVVSSSFCVAKGVITGPDQLHVCMCYTPVRYSWDMELEYLSDRGLTGGVREIVIRYVMHRLRLWDTASANRVDHYIAISNFVARRIGKYYARESSVIFPPVAIEKFGMEERKDDFYLIASRMAPYKRVPIVVEAFRRMPDRRLVVIGTGAEAARVADAAAGASNIQVLGRCPEGELRDYMQRARAFVFAGKEDFGIVMVEAQACGTPVIAYKGGGALDIVRTLGHSSPTGILFDQQSPEAICAAVDAFEARSGDFSPRACRANAERFGIDRFHVEFMDLLTEQFGRLRRDIEKPAPVLRTVG